jgi:hypothetical protein
MAKDLKPRRSRAEWRKRRIAARYFSRCCVHRFRFRPISMARSKVAFVLRKLKLPSRTRSAFSGRFAMSLIISRQELAATANTTTPLGVEGAGGRYLICPP